MNAKFTSFLRLFVVLALLTGMSSVASAWDVPPGRYYYDNSVTKWEGKLWYYVGKADAGRENSIPDANKLEGTDIIFYERASSSNTWAGAEVAYFVLSETTPTRITTGVEAIATYLATLQGASSVIDHSSVGQLLRADGTFQLMDVYFTFNGGMSGTYNLATKVSDTEWEWIGNYGGNEFFAVSTNNPTLGNAATGVGVFEVQITPNVTGTVNAGDEVKVTYKTNGIVAAPSAEDEVTIALNNGSGFKENTLPAVAIYNSGNAIAINLNGKSTVQIYNAQGSLIASDVASGAYNYPLSAGAYIVKVNGKAYKFLKK